MAPRYVLIGPPGAGKSTVARALSSLLKVARRDTDADIERVTGKSISDIFIDEGEEHFRRIERDIVLVALGEHDGVLALGGGAVLDPDVQDSIEQYKANGGHVVLLDVSLAAAAPRIGLNSSRPLLLGNPRKQWAELLEARIETYRRLASFTVNTDRLDAARIAREIVEATA